MYGRSCVFNTNDGMIAAENECRPVQREKEERARVRGSEKMKAHPGRERGREDSDDEPRT